ncbi:MAG TPA: universal stress protein [Azospirillum sp.]
MLPETRTILYAADLGDLSTPAFNRAAAEAVRHGARLTVLHIVEPATGPAAKLLASYMADNEVRAMRAGGIQHLVEALTKTIETFCAEQLADGITLPFPPEPRVEEGYPPETIVRVAGELDADLIVMGTRTRTHTVLGRFFLGSTAQSVLQLSDRPVLVVPLSA